MADIIPINLPSLPRLVIQWPGGVIEPLGPNNYQEAFDLDDGFADWMAEHLDELFVLDDDDLEGSDDDDEDVSLGDIDIDDPDDDDALDPIGT